MTILVRHAVQTIFVISLAIVVWHLQLSGGYKTLLAKPPSLASTPATSSNPWSLVAITSAFRTYEQSANAEMQKMRTSYGKLDSSHLDILERASLPYSSKLQRLDEATTANSVITSAIADLAIRELGVNGTEVDKQDGGSLFRTREALLHFVRDWSDEGKEERRVIFESILEVLKEVPREDRGGMRVLVPGSGLGRLAWDISEIGFKATANELSWYMSLGLRFLLHPSTTSKVYQHIIHPFSHRFTNQRSNDLLFRSIRFPDVIPRYSSHFTLAEGDFLHQTPPERENGESGYDFIVTQFFIDTGHNVVATLSQIHSLLRPGGTWINLGPLLWAGGGTVMLELSLDEVLEVARGVGFEILGQEQGKTFQQRTVACEYTADKLGTFQRIYHAEFWVARKKCTTSLRSAHRFAQLLDHHIILFGTFIQSLCEAHSEHLTYRYWPSIRSHLIRQRDGTYTWSWILQQHGGWMKVRVVGQDREGTSLLFKIGCTDHIESVDTMGTRAGHTMRTRPMFETIIPLNHAKLHALAYFYIHPESPSSLDQIEAQRSIGYHLAITSTFAQSESMA